MSPADAQGQTIRELCAVLRLVLPYAEACIGLPRASWPQDSVILQAERALAEAEGGRR